MRSIYLKYKMNGVRRIPGLICVTTVQVGFQNSDHKCVRVNCQVNKIDFRGSSFFRGRVFVFPGSSFFRGWVFVFPGSSVFGLRFSGLRFSYTPHEYCCFRTHLVFVKMGINSYFKQSIVICVFKCNQVK